MFRSIGFIEENPNLQFLRLLLRDCHVLIQNLLGEGLWDDQAWCTWCRPKDVCTDPSLGVFGPNNDLQTNPKTILANIFFFDETNSSRWGEIVGGVLGMGETSKQTADKSVDPFPPPPPPFFFGPLLSLWILMRHNLFNLPQKLTYQWIQSIFPKQTIHLALQSPQIHQIPPWNETWSKEKKTLWRNNLLLLHTKDWENIAREKISCFPALPRRRTEYIYNSRK